MQRAAISTSLSPWPDRCQCAVRSAHRGSAAARRMRRAACVQADAASSTSMRGTLGGDGRCRCYLGCSTMPRGGMRSAKRWPMLPGVWSAISPVPTACVSWRRSCRLGRVFLRRLSRSGNPAYRARACEAARLAGYPRACRFARTPRQGGQHARRKRLPPIRRAFDAPLRASPCVGETKALLERVHGIVQGPASRHGQKVGVPNVQPDKQSLQSVNQVVHRHTRYPPNRWLT